MLVKVLIIFTACFTSCVISHRRFSKDEYENLVNLLYEKYKLYKRDHIPEDSSRNDYSSTYRTKARDKRVYDRNTLGNDISKRSNILSLHSVTPVHDDESTDDAAKRHFKDLHDGVSKFDFDRSKSDILASVQDSLPKMDLITPVHDDEEDATQKHIVPIHDDMDLTANHFLEGFKNMDNSQNSNANSFGKNDDNEVDDSDNYFGTDGTYHIKNMENDKEESILEVEGGSEDQSNSVLQHMKHGMEVHSIQMPHVAPQKGPQSAAVGKLISAPVSNQVKKKEDNKMKKVPATTLKKATNDCEKNHKMKMNHVQVKDVILNFSIKDKKCIGNKSQEVSLNEVLKLNAKSNSSKSSVPLSIAHNGLSKQHNLELNEIPSSHVQSEAKESSSSSASNFFKGRVMAEKNTHGADYNTSVALFRKEKQNQTTDKNSRKVVGSKGLQKKKEKQHFAKVMSNSNHSNKSYSTHHVQLLPPTVVHKNLHKQQVDESPDVFHVKEPQPVDSPKQSTGVIITDTYPDDSNVTSSNATDDEDTEEYLEDTIEGDYENITSNVVISKNSTLSFINGSNNQDQIINIEKNISANSSLSKYKNSSFPNTKANFDDFSTFENDINNKSILSKNYTCHINKRNSSLINSNQTFSDLNSYYGWSRESLDPGVIDFYSDCDEIVNDTYSKSNLEVKTVHTLANQTKLFAPGKNVSSLKNRVYRLVDGNKTSKNKTRQKNVTIVTNNNDSFSIATHSNNSSIFRLKYWIADLTNDLLSTRKNNRMNLRKNYHIVGERNSKKLPGKMNESKNNNVTDLISVHYNRNNFVPPKVLSQTSFTPSKVLSHATNSKLDKVNKKLEIKDMVNNLVAESLNQNIDVVLGNRNHRNEKTHFGEPELWSFKLDESAERSSSSSSKASSGSSSSRRKDVHNITYLIHDGDKSYKDTQKIAHNLSDVLYFKHEKSVEPELSHKAELIHNTFQDQREAFKLMDEKADLERLLNKTYDGEGNSEDALYDNDVGEDGFIDEGEFVDNFENYDNIKLLVEPFTKRHKKKTPKNKKTNNKVKVAVSNQTLYHNATMTDNHLASKATEYPNINKPMYTYQFNDSKTQNKIQFFKKNNTFAVVNDTGSIRTNQNNSSLSKLNLSQPTSSSLKSNMNKTKLSNTTLGAIRNASGGNHNSSVLKRKQSFNPPANLTTNLIYYFENNSWHLLTPIDKNKSAIGSVNKELDDNKEEKANFNINSISKNIHSNMSMPKTSLQNSSSILSKMNRSNTALSNVTKSNSTSHDPHQVYFYQNNTWHMLDSMKEAMKVFDPVEKSITINDWVSRMIGKFNQTHTDEGGVVDYTAKKHQMRDEFRHRMNITYNFDNDSSVVKNKSIGNNLSKNISIPKAKPTSMFHHPNSDNVLTMKTSRYLNNHIYFYENNSWNSLPAVKFKGTIRDGEIDTTMETTSFISESINKKRLFYVYKNHTMHIVPMEKFQHFNKVNYSLNQEPDPYWYAKFDNLSTNHTLMGLNVSLNSWYFDNSNMNTTLNSMLPINSSLAVPTLKSNFSVNASHINHNDTSPNTPVTLKTLIHTLSVPTKEMLNKSSDHQKYIFFNSSMFSNQNKVSSIGNFAQNLSSSMNDTSDEEEDEEKIPVDLYEDSYSSAEEENENYNHEHENQNAEGNMSSIQEENEAPLYEEYKEDLNLSALNASSLINGTMKNQFGANGSQNIAEFNKSNNVEDHEIRKLTNKEDGEDEDEDNEEYTPVFAHINLSLEESKNHKPAYNNFEMAKNLPSHQKHVKKRKNETKLIKPFIRIHHPTLRMHHLNRTYMKKMVWQGSKGHVTHLPLYKISSRYPNPKLSGFKVMPTGIDIHRNKHKNHTQVVVGNDYVKIYNRLLRKHHRKPHLLNPMVNEIINNHEIRKLTNEEYNLSINNKPIHESDQYAFNSDLNSLVNNPVGSFKHKQPSPTKAPNSMVNPINLKPSNSFLDKPMSPVPVDNTVGPANPYIFSVNDQKGPQSYSFKIDNPVSVVWGHDNEEEEQSYDNPALYGAGDESDENEELDDISIMNVQMPDVSPQVMDTYLCYAHKLPEDRRYIVEYQPLAEKRIAHHMLLFGCDEPYSRTGVWPCREMTPVCKGRGQSIMYAWAKNAPPLKMPTNVGFEVGGDSGYKYLVLQVHYLNVDKFVKEGETDNSGIRFFLDKTDKRFLAGIYLLANGFTPIPPHMTKAHIDMGCYYPNGPKFFPFRFRVHAHKLGVVITGYRVRNNNWTIIGRGDPQRPQAFFNVFHDIDIQPGDTLMGRCTYNSTSRDTVTEIGATHSDEMCNFYIMYFYDTRFYKGGYGEFPCGPVNKETKGSLFNKFPEDSDIALATMEEANRLNFVKKEEGANVTDSAKASSFTDDPGATLAMEEVGALSYESYDALRIFKPTIHLTDILSQLPARNFVKRQSEENSLEYALQGVLDMAYKPVHGWPVDGLKDGELPLTIGQVTGVDLTNDNKQVVILHRGDRVWGFNTFNRYNVLNKTYQDKAIEVNPIVWLDRKTGAIKKAKGAGLFYLPHGITIDTKGNIWITDVGSHQVYKLSPEMKVLMTLGHKFVPGHHGPSHFCKPTDVAVMGNGDFYVSDGYCNNRVVKFDINGKMLLQISADTNPNKGIFPSPQIMSVVHSLSLDDNHKCLFVADRENGRILMFNATTGRYHKQIKVDAGAVYAVEYNPREGGFLHFITGPLIDEPVDISGYTYSVLTDSIVSRWGPEKGFSLPHDLAVSDDNKDAFVAEINPYKIWKFSKVKNRP